MKPSQAEVDAVARRLLATVPEPPRCRPGDQALRPVDFIALDRRPQLFVKLESGPFIPTPRLAYHAWDPAVETGRLMDAALRMAALRRQRRPLP